jgi:hypothetical protein
VVSGESAARLLGFAVLVPAAGAVAIVWLSRQLLRGDASARYSAAAGFVGGFVIGSWLLTDAEDWLPTRHWHWLPFLALAAGLIAPIGNARGVSLPERWLLILLLTVASAWFLVPTWSSLDPSREFWVTALSSVLFLLAAGLDPLPGRVGSRPVLLSLWGTSLAVTLMIGLCVSVTYAGMAAAASGSLAGLCLETVLRRRPDPRSSVPGRDRSMFSSAVVPETGSSETVRRNGLSEEELAACALLPAATIVLGGAAFVGCIEPQHPLYGLLVLPAAPLGLWLSAVRPFKSRTGRTILAVQFGAVAIPLFAAATQVFFAS